ncbi:hypothetical protein MWMV7_MWMV7_02537 [Acinetobacter calcoaceticus]|uniref:Uncharacterized protein n=1 Tax=Acinetobacter calcoaceticus TaxID=471 RepID=A0A446ZNL4_ACICA|nr:MULTISPECIES: hypothetical protein [Acinetobacter]MEB3863476.1 hypothetical protein [Acinetobacter sp. IK31]CAI3148810.1 hypothetical protein MWMV7_MWMV7_02537 [Acinetobacter calcoaceticus]VAX46082.1 Uncharacterised protein [Acinetobacter calcoaceticus]
MNIDTRYQIGLLCLIMMNVNGCTSHPHQSVNLQEYLKGFLGKPAATIQQDLNLRSLGFQVLKTPQKTQDQLIYTILRPINIPIPMVSNVDMRGNSVAIQSGNLGGNSYDVNFNCKVIFQLKNNIAQSIQYEGKAC